MANRRGHRTKKTGKGLAHGLEKSSTDFWVQTLMIQTMGQGSLFLLKRIAGQEKSQPIQSSVECHLIVLRSPLATRLRSSVLSSRTGVKWESWRLKSFPVDHRDCSRIRTKDLGRVLVQIIWDRKEGKRKVKKKAKKTKRMWSEYD